MDQRLPFEPEPGELGEQLFEGIGGGDEVLPHERHPFPLMRGRMRLEPAEFRGAVDIPLVAPRDPRRGEDFPDLRSFRNEIA